MKLTNSNFTNAGHKQKGRKFYPQRFGGGNLNNADSAFGMGRNTLSDPSSVNQYSDGQIPGTNTLGGGYYFIPPIPNRRIADLSEQFFS